MFLNYKQLIRRREVRLRILSALSWLPDTWMVRLQYKLHTGRTLRLKNPQRFTEKLQHYKCFYRNPLLSQIVDKASLRDYLDVKGLGEYSVPLVGIFDSLEEINPEDLPRQFVIKTTSGGGSTEVYVCRNFDAAAWDEINSRFGHLLRKRLGKSPGREWAYYGIDKPRLVVEELLCDPGCPEADLVDYKFFCFGGIPRFCQVITDRSTNEHIDFYDTDWHRLLGVVGLNVSAANSPMAQPRPIHYEEMLDLAAKLSRPFPFVRVDLYNVAGKIYVGELTFYPASGYGGFIPDSFDFELGKLFDINYVSIVND